MRVLQAVSAEPEQLLARLPQLLAGHGPAIFPVEQNRFASQSHGNSDIPASEYDDVLPRTVPDEVSLVIRTSGSTGKPKHVLLSTEALVSSARATAEVLGEGQWMLALPASYVAGFQVLMRSVVAGYRPVFTASAGFSVAGFVDAVDRMTAERTFTSLVPVQVVDLIREAERDSAVAETVRRLTRILVGGQRLEPSVRERAESLGIPLVATYGASETCGGCVYDGRPLPSVEIRLVDGRVHLAGPMLAQGYLDDALNDETFPVIDGRRWFRTDDSGELRDGVLAVTGRRDQQIIRGGLKLDLAEVERELALQPGLHQARAVPVEDERWGQGYAVVADGRVRSARITREQLSHQLTTKFGRHAKPSALIYSETGMPMLPNGKVDRVGLKEYVVEHMKNDSDETKGVVDQ